MSYTDQAFIKAYRTDTQAEAVPVAGPAMRTQESGSHGPHASFANAAPSPKRPLSQAIAEERAAAEAAASASRGVQEEIAGVTLERFAVPAIAEQLAERCGAEYRRMLAYACRSGGVIGLLGAGHGVGCSTTTLAAGLALASGGGDPVAVIDAAPAETTLANSLGVAHCRSIARCLADGGVASSALVHGVQQNLSLGVAFDDHTLDERRVSGALRSLTAAHAAVLVDLGCDVESIATQPTSGVDSLRLDAIVLVRRAHADEAEAHFARRVLTAAGQTVVGVVESFA